MNAVALAKEPVAEDLLTSISNEELTKCERLQPQSVAQHRAKFGAVPIATSSEDHSAGGATKLSPAALKTFEEALALVRERDENQRAREAKAPEPKGPTVKMEEHRRDMRISVTAPVKISDLYGKHISPATLKNISWGGAAIRCENLPAAMGERLCLLLPAGLEENIKIVAGVLRHKTVDGEDEYGLRFDSLVPGDEERLLSVLKLLMSSPDQDKRRSEARLVQRLEVEYGDAGEFQAVLEDISASGLMLTVPTPLDIDQSILITLSSADTAFGLNLRARVVHQTEIEQSEIALNRIGLRFEHPSPHLRERVATVVNELATLRMRDLPFVDSL
jgi:c-di-GMP-binding flagellar brake protein YcgR